MKHLFAFTLLFVGLTALPANAASPESSFIAAREAFRSGDIARLNAYAPRLKGHVLQPFVTYLQLSSRLKDASLEEIHDFMAKNADSHLADRLRGEWLKMLGKNQDWTLFLNEYPALLGGDTELTCYALQARAAQNDPAALPEAKRLWFAANELPTSCDPLFAALANNGQLLVDDVWTRLRLTFEAGNLSVARNVARYLPKQYELPLRALDSAADNPAAFLDRLTVDLDTRAGRELVILALARVARTQPQQALPYWNTLQARFSAEERAYGWGQLALQAARKHDPDALNWYGKAAGAPLNDLQTAWKVRAALRTQNWTLVLSTIESMTEDEQALPTWRYWKARALKAAGKIAPANALLTPLSREHHYYAQLASEELGAVLSSPTESYRPAEEEIKTAENTPAFQRALLLYELNLRYDANKEWGWAIRNLDDRQLLAAAELARRNGWYDRAIATADKTVQLHDFSLRYPSPHREVMQDYTRQVGIDEAWVYGLIRQESRFVQQAHSGAGASGLMQLMPATAKWVAKKLGMRDYRQNLVTQLNTNVALGTYYLKYVLDQLDGQPVLATAAYNAGPRRAQRWRDEKPMEGAIYTETIPFTETRGYVQKVMSNAVHYASRFGQQIRSLKQRLGTITPPSGKDCAGQDERSPTCE